MIYINFFNTVWTQFNQFCPDNTNPDQNSFRIFDWNPRRLQNLLKLKSRSIASPKLTIWVTISIWNTEIIMAFWLTILISNTLKLIFLVKGACLAVICYLNTLLYMSKFVILLKSFTYFVSGWEVSSTEPNRVFRFLQSLHWRKCNGWPGWLAQWKNVCLSIQRSEFKPARSILCAIK